MTGHQHYGVPCTVEWCKSHYLGRAYERWSEEEDAALLAAPDLLTFVRKWRRGVMAAEQRRNQLINQRSQR